MSTQPEVIWKTVALEATPPPSQDHPSKTEAGGLRVDAIRRFVDATTEKHLAIPNPMKFAPTIDGRIKIEKAFTVRIEGRGGTTACQLNRGVWSRGAHSGSLA